MKFEVEDVSSVRKKINIVMPKEMVGEKIDLAFNRLKRQAKVKGFRPGKVPRHILEKKFKGQVLGEVLEDIVKESYPRALEGEGIKPVSYPEYSGEAIKEGEDFAFSFSVDVKPVIEPKGYEGVKVTKAKVSATAEEVEKELQVLRKKVATFSSVGSGGIEMGDEITFDFEGFIDGEALEGGFGKDATLEIGAGQFIPGFEEELIGFTKGQKGELKVRFPDDYHADKLAGKEALFKVHVKEIKRPEYPDMDDDFARDNGDYETLDQLKAKIEADICAVKEESARKELQQALIDAVLAENPFEVPETMVEKEAEYRMEETRQQMAQYGMPPEEVEKSLKTMSAETRKTAEKRVRTALLLEEIAAKEKIEVSDDDVTAYFEVLAKQSGQTVDQVRKYFEEKETYLKPTLRDNKILAFLESKAKIEEK